MRPFLSRPTVLALTLTAVAGVGAMVGSDGNRSSSDEVPGTNGQAPIPGGAQGPGTRRMAERLDDLIKTLDPQQNLYVNTQRAAFLRSSLEQAKTPEERVRTTARLADELLKAGESEQAIRLIEPFLQAGQEGPRRAPPVAETRSFLGLAYMRLGEQQNCITRHSIDSCLVPIKGGGIHTLQAGSRAAIEQFTAVLRSNPNDLSARWLLNLAAMTIGEYPDKVPRAWLIPPKAFESEYDIKRFVDVAPTAGLSNRSHAGGAIMEDFDADGLLDLMVSSVGLRDQLRLFRNNGDGTFSDRTEAAGLTGEVGGLNLVHADYDNDGFPDVLVLRGGWMKRGGRYPNSLLRNRGDGTFEDVTEAAGVLSFHPTQTAAWGDYDNDGWLDLFIGNESTPDDPHPCELYHNNRDGTFTNKAVDLGGADLGYVKGVVWGDFNNDGRQDLYVSVHGGDNFLFRNDGKRVDPGPLGEDWQFTNVSREAGTREPRYSFPTWFWDYDNDGWLDIFVGGFSMKDAGDIAAMYLGLPSRAEMPRLYHNNHDGTFTDVTHAVKLDRLLIPMGSNFGDLDNDGWLDCYFGTGDPTLLALLPNRMFRNAGGVSFQDVTTSGGFGNVQKGHAVAFGDIDNDGDQDIFEVMGGAYEGDFAMNVFFRNPGHGNHWITLRLEGRRSNRSAIGARIRVRVRNETGGRDIYATVGSGGSFGGSSLQQEIGLGRAVSIESIDVTWPATGEIQTFRDAAIDRTYKIVEGDPKLTSVPTRTFSL